MADKNVHVEATRRPAQEPTSEEDTFAPLVDVYERKDGTTVLEVEMPGAAGDSVDLRVDKGVLTISATGGLPEVAQDLTLTYQGFSDGKYYRAFALSDEVDREKIAADYRNGVLTVRLPRAQAAQTRKIEIKSE